MVARIEHRFEDGLEHYTNLQPMWGGENIRKRNRYNVHDKHAYLKQWLDLCVFKIFTFIKNKSTMSTQKKNTTPKNVSISIKKKPYFTNKNTIAFLFILVFSGVIGVVVFLLYTSSTSTISNSEKTKCPENNGDLVGWYFYDDVICFYNSSSETTSDRRRRLFIGSVYRSLTDGIDSSDIVENIEFFNGAYWGVSDGYVAGNILPRSMINTSCTSESTHKGCQNFFWERIVNGTVVDITNPRGLSASSFIQTRIDNGGIWEDLSDTSGDSNFCKSAINTEEAKSYISKFPNILPDLSSTVNNTYNSSDIKHRMLCNMIEYPYYPDTTRRGGVDGNRVFNIFTVEILDNQVYYTYLCNKGDARLLSAHEYQPIWLILLTKLYSKYVSNVDYNITMNYTPQKYVEYKNNIVDIPCNPLISLS